MKKGYKTIVNELPIEGYMSPLSSDQLAQLQKILFKSAVEIAEVCEKHGIGLFLVGGSALGAVRHNGFIPWDDDLDVGMTRDEFEKFKEIFESQLSNDYILNSPNYSLDPITRFPKILIKNTKLETLDMSGDQRANIYIDLFILENVPKNLFIRKIKGFFANLLTGISSYVYSYNHRNERFNSFMNQTPYSRKVFRKRIRIGRFFSIIKLEKWLNLVDKSFQYKKDTGIVGFPSGRKHYFGEIFDRKTFLPFSKKVFCGYDFNVPNDCDLYLRQLYGDYMQIPPVEKREKHNICVISFDTRCDGTSQ